MNGPSINNIDQWLFEAAEGNLSATQEAQLDAFLLENPAFVEEQEVWAEAKVVADSPVYPHIDTLLKKPIWVRPAVYIPAAAVVIFGMVYGFSTFMNSDSLESNEPNQPTTSIYNEQVEGSANGTDANSGESAPNNASASITEQQNTDGSHKAESNPIVAEIDNSETVDGTIEYKPLSATRSTEQTASANRDENASISKEYSGSAEPAANNEPKTALATINPSENRGSDQDAVAHNDGLNQKEGAANADESTQIKEEPIYTAVVVKSENQENQSEKTADIKGSNSPMFNPDADENSVHSGGQTAQALPRDETSASSKNVLEEITATLEREPVEALMNPAGQYAEIDGPVLKPKYDQTRIASNYDASFKSVMRTSMRKLVRMMDNPLALKNAKDMVYHVPNMQTLDVNFSSVGSMMVPRLQLVSRAQYVGRSNEQLMNQLAFDSYVRSLRGGVGVQLMNSYYGQGAYNTSQIALAYSPKIGVSKNVVIEPGMRVKFGNTLVNQKKLNPSQLVEVNRMNVEPFFDENSTSIGSSLWYQDVGVSLLTNTKWFTAGVQIDNLGRHYENVYNNLNPLGRRAPLHFTAMLGTDYVSRNKNISFSPYTFYQKMEKLSEIWAGSIFRLKSFTIGGAYSSLGDFAGSIGFKTNLVMFTYSADYTTSAVFNTRLLSHQLSLRILFNSGPYSQRMLKLK